MKNHIKKIIAFTLLSLLILVGVAYYSIVYTNAGLRVATKLAQPILQQYHIRVRPNAIHGTLANLHIRQLTIGAGIEAVIKQLTLKWQPSHLLRGNIEITKLSAKQLILSSSARPAPPDQQNDQQANQPILPTVTIKALHIGQIIWKNTTQKIEFGQLDSAISITDHRQINVQTLALITKQHQLHVTGHLLLVPKWRVYLKAKWHQALAQNQQLTIPILINGSASYYQGKVGLDITQNQQRQLSISTQFTGNSEHLTTHYWHSVLINGPDNPIEGNISINWHQAPTWQVQVKSKPLNLSALNARLNHSLQVNINSTKTAKTSHSKLLIEYGNHHISLDTNGVALANGWQTTIGNFDAQTPLGHWQTKHLSIINISHHTISWQKFCLHHLQAAICSSGQWQPSDWHIRVNSNNIDLAQFSAPIYGTKQTGKLHFNLDLQKYSHSAIVGQLSVILEHFSLNPIQHNPLFTYQHPLKITHANWQVDLKPQTLQSQLVTQFDQDGKIEATLKLGRQGTHPLSAHANAKIRNIGIFNNFVPALYQLSGQLDSKFSIDGTLAKPSYHGQLSVQHASTVLPLYGISLKDATVQMHSNQNGNVKFSAHASSGTGQIHLTGRFKWQHNTPIIEANVTGQNFTLLNTPAIKLAISPKLVFGRNGQRQTLTGTVVIPSANINANLLHNRLNNSDDIVWTDANGKPLSKKPILPFYSNLVLTLGKHIQIQGFGIYAHVIGQLNIDSQPNAPTSATGTLKLTKARYQNYGKVFNITKGLILFGKRPLNNPSLDIVAHYQLTPGNLQDSLQAIEIGVRVLGTVKKPQISLFSQPSMSQANILSYIVVGVPLGRVQGDEKSALSRAALSYSINGGEDHSLLSTIQDTLGIDQISVGSIDGTSSMPANANNPNSNVTNDQAGQDNTAIFIGKSISPRLYISYGVGLFNQQQELRTRYQLSRHFQLLTDHSSDYSGADLVFTINH